MTAILDMHETPVSDLKGLGSAAVRMGAALPAALVGKFDDAIDALLDRIEARIYATMGSPASRKITVTRYQDRLMKATLHGDVDAVVRLLGDPPPDTE
jgi:hypothetical protein